MKRFSDPGEQALYNETGLERADLPDDIGDLSDYLNDDGTIDYELLAQDLF
jgi:hypothetical protein